MRRSVYPVASVAIAFLVAVPASAQSVDEIVAKNLKAKGGADVLRQTNSVKMTGTFKAFQPTETTMAMTTWAKRPNFLRQEAEGTPPPRQDALGMPAGPQKPVRMIRASDGTTMWMQQGSAPAQTLPAGQSQTPQDTEFDSVFIDYQAKGVVINNLGVEKVAGRDVYHLAVKRKTGPLQHYYLDTETGLEAKVSTDVSQGGAITQSGPTMKIETEMSDYRAVEGRMVPFKLRQSVDRQVQAEITIETVEFNGEMPDALFKVPMTSGVPR